MACGRIACAQHRTAIHGTVPLAAAGRAERLAQSANDQTRSLSEQMGVMVRQIRRLQVDVQALKGES